MKKKIRPMGHVTNDLEVILDEMAYDHDLQWGEILALVFSWLSVHAISQKEVYVEDGSSPVYSYGPDRSNKRKY